MIIEIKQVIGGKDLSPEKEALLNAENITKALNLLYPDETFIVKVVENGTHED